MIQRISRGFVSRGRRFSRKSRGIAHGDALSSGDRDLTRELGNPRGQRASGIAGLPRVISRSIGPAILAAESREILESHASAIRVCNLSPNSLPSRFRQPGEDFVADAAFARRRLSGRCSISLHFPIAALRDKDVCRIMKHLLSSLKPLVVYLTDS